MKRFSRYFTVCVLLGLAAAVEAAPSARDARTDVELIPGVAAARPGEPFGLALRFAPDPGWHVYWRNPGDSGMAPSAEWSLPDGFSVGEFQWPYPETIEAGGLVTYGYDGEMSLLAEVRPTDTAGAGPVHLAATVKWLACKIECVPGSATLDVNIPWAAPQTASAPGEELAARFAAWRRQLPQAADGWTITAQAGKNGYELDAAPPDWSRFAAFTSTTLPPDFEGTYFFPQGDDVLDHAAPQPLTLAKNGFRLTLTPSALRRSPAGRLQGILFFPAMSYDAIPLALQIDTPVSAGASGRGSPAAATETPVTPSPSGLQAAVPAAQVPSLPAILMFALLGGLILNLMPCVLPVLSLKVLHLVKIAGADHRHRALGYGLVFALGIVTAFCLLAGVLLMLRAAGEQIGWGFQFQHPVFLVFLTWLFLAMALNFFGVYGFGAVAVSSVPRHHNVLLENFSSGMLATLVATPCTAPFMGTAIGVALGQSVPVALLIFSFLGLGMALPFVILSAFPSLLRFVPRPGPWMDQLKALLGFVLVAVVIWLLWVFGLQTGPNGLTVLMWALFVLALALWLWGQAAAFSGRAGLWYRGLAVFVMVVSVSISAEAVKMTPADTSAAAQPGAGTAESGLTWQPFSAALVEQLRAQGRPVFIDFTASWCLSCQVNKRVALKDPSVVARFQKDSIVPVVADWTNRSAVITEALAAFGKSSIPVYVYYPARGRNPVLLPEILTPGVVLEALDSANEQSGRK